MFLKITFILLTASLLFSCSGTKNVNSNTKYENTATAGTVKEEKENPYFDEDYLVYTNKTYFNSIKTVLAYNRGFELSDPAMQLNGRDTLVFSFDELTSDLGSYYYTLIHCESDWKKSDLLETEYLDGFFQEFISSYSYSFNTLQQYIHYKVQIPNKNLRPTKSGNYIFKVYQNNNPDDVVLTKRFIVYENIIKIEPTVIRPTILDDRDYKQEIDFNIDLGNLVVNNIQNDIKVVLMQNNRWDNAVTSLTPLFVRGNYLIYDYNKENVFDGGNEYRFLNIKSIRYRGQKVKNILVENKQTYIDLFTEQKRTYKNYMNYQDLNGKYIVKIQEGINSDIEADYASVHFSFAFDHKETSGDFYVFGGISDYQFKDNFKLIYDEAKQVYETTVMLKQGYYDYHYVLKKNNGKSDVTAIEGNHFETDNAYTIITYVRDQKSDYDRIIGYHNFLSH
jgi:hypothetical protein